MARNKHATALFEVIHSAKKPPTQSGGGFSTPKWWFKRRDGTAAISMSSPASVPQPVIKSVAAPRPEPVPQPRYVPEPEVVTEPPVEIEPPRVRETPTAREQRYDDRATFEDETDVQDDDRSSGVRFSRTSSGSSSRGEMQFKLTYTRVAIAALAIGALLGGMYLAGSRFGTKPEFNALMPTPPVTEQASTEELKTRPAQPAVMDIRPTAPVEATSTRQPPAMTVLAASAAQNVTPTASLKTPAADVVASPEAPKPVQETATPPATGAVRRTVGLNYVICQCYPDLEHAQKAQAVLKNNGVSTTIVKGPPGYAMRGWYSVIGTAGFSSKLSTNPIFTAYKKKIEDAGDYFSGGSKAFMRFNPAAFKWTEAAEEAANPTD